jgi:serine/threonine protein kinase
MPVIDRALVAAALPRYTLGDQIGSGAFALVLAAHDTELDRPVAIKVLPAGPSGDRFQTEARILTRLDHPHIARAYDYARADDCAFLIMELLGGGTLARRQLTAVAACAVGIAMADALAHAQARGVLHRDIKPDNILFTTAGQPKLTDFGLGRIVAEPTGTAGPLVGTPRYLAPEVISGEPASPRADLYALGVVLHELLTGRPMFAPGLSPPEILRHQLEVTPPVPDGIPEAVTAVLMAILAKDPALRPANARVLLHALTDATATAYGDDWATRSGLVLRLRQGLGDEEAVPPAPSPALLVVPQQPPHSDQSGPATLDTTPDGLVLPTGRLAQPEPPGPPHGPAVRRPPWRRRRPLLVLAAAVAAAALTTSGLLVGLGGRSASPASASSSPSAPAARTVSLSLLLIGALAPGPNGSVYLAGAYDHLVALLAPTGQETAVAGTGTLGFAPATGTPGFAGDGGLATDAELDTPSNVGVDSKGDFYILDTGNQTQRIRRVDRDGRITTVAGGGTMPDSSLTGQAAPATSVRFSGLGGQLAVDPEGDVYVATGSRVYEVTSAGTIRAVALIGATSPTLPQLTAGKLGALAVHDDQLYGTDIDHDQVRVLARDGAVSTVAGTGTGGDAGDGGLAVNASLDLSSPGGSASVHQAGIAVDTAGDLLIAEPARNRIRRVDRSGTITAAAGTGVAGDTTVTTPAASANLLSPNMIAATLDGGYLVGSESHLYRVDPGGVLHVLPTS